MNQIPAIALSIRQPWASLIVLGFKPLENRDWPTKFRGRFAVHASSVCTKKEYRAAMEFALAINEDLIDFPDLYYPNLKRGGLIGEATIVDCFSHHPSPWFIGDYGFLLTQPIAYPTLIPCKGTTFFFKHGVVNTLCTGHSEALQKTC